MLPATVTLGTAASVMKAFVPDPAIGFAADTVSLLMFVHNPGLSGSPFIPLPREIVAGDGPGWSTSWIVATSFSLYGSGELSESDIRPPLLPAGSGGGTPFSTIGLEGFGVAF